MDIVDPLDTSNPELEDHKIIINNLKTNIDSDEEQIVEHLAPQTVLQTQDSDLQYSFRSPEGSMITYRVVQLDNGTESSQFSNTTSNFLPATTLPQVISGTNLNGQIYVIGSPTSYTSSTSSTTNRAIAPRPTIRAPVLDASVVVQVKKKDERRRATHNEVERRRRDKINNWIAKLAKILPENSSEASKGSGQYDGHSKGGILAKAFEYISELQMTETRLNSCLKENKKLANSIEQLKQRNLLLETENKELKEILKKHGVAVETCTVRKS